MKMKRTVGIIAAISILISAFCAHAADGNGIKTFADLQSAFAGGFSESYTLENNIDVTNSGITSSITIDGKNMTLNSTQTDGNSTIYQNENVNSVLKNVIINGNTKPEVGI